jgi:GTP-binding protein
VAFAGRSNVGKSSLLNRLAGRRALARVSKTPGRTQQINFFEVGGRVVFVDLPGYGYARVPRAVQAGWRVLVEHYLGTRQALRAVVVIVDVRRGVEVEERQLLDYLATHDLPVILVATKVDKLGRDARARQLRAIAAASGLDPIPFAAPSGEGTQTLWRRIDELLTPRREEPGSGRAARGQVPD